MRILFLGVLLFSFCGAAAAQPIFKPFKGERGLIKLSRMSIDIAKMGGACGDYFTYQPIRDQKVLSFEVPVTMEEKRIGVTYFYRLELRIIRFMLDDKAKIPTAEFYKGSDTRQMRGRQIVIRISKSDYKAAKCLSEGR